MSATSYKQPLVPLIDNPVNIDTPIQEMQQALAAGLPWLSKSFGRSWESFRKDPKGKTWIYPEVWQGPNLDLISVMPNDNLDSQSFFRVEDPITVTDYSSNMYNRMNAIVSIIFWMNLKYIDPDLTYRYVEVLKAQAQRVITETGLSNGTFTINRTWEGAANVFRGYTFDPTSDESFALMHPYAGFRFECGLNYVENCPDAVFPFIT